MLKPLGKLISAAFAFLAAILLAPVRKQPKNGGGFDKPVLSLGEYVLMLGLLLLLGLVLFLPASARAAAATEITVYKLTRTGVTITPSTVDSTNGNKFSLATDGVYLRFANPGATNTTITATDRFTNPQGYTYDATIYVPAGVTVDVGPWLRSRWADSTGYLTVSYAGNTTTTVAARRLPIGEPDSQTK